MNFLRKIASALLSVSWSLHVLAGLIGGLWLVYLAEVHLLFYGIIGLFVGPLVLMAALIGGWPLAGIVSAAYRLNMMRRAYVFGGLGLVFVMSILSAWCLAVLWFFLQHVNQESRVPGLLWSFGVATGPIVWMAGIDKLRVGALLENYYATISAFFFQIAYLSTIGAVLLYRTSFIDVLVLFISIIILGIVLELALALKIYRGTKFR